MVGKRLNQINMPRLYAYDKGGKGKLDWKIDGTEVPDGQPDFFADTCLADGFA